MRRLSAVASTSTRRSGLTEGHRSAIDVESEALPEFLRPWVHGKHLDNDRATLRKGLADGSKGFAPKTSTSRCTLNEELTKMDVQFIGEIVVPSELMQRVSDDGAVLLQEEWTAQLLLSHLCIRSRN